MEKTIAQSDLPVSRKIPPKNGNTAIQKSGIFGWFPKLSDWKSYNGPKQMILGVKKKKNQQVQKEKSISKSCKQRH